MDIKGKRVLVTGGSSGIGLEIARQALGEGARVMLSARSADRVDRAVDTLAPLGEVKGIAADVGTADGRRTMLAAALDAFGGLDILVNNAGNVRAGRLEQLDPEAIRAMIEVDLAGPVYLTQAALPALRESGEGLIVNVSSVIALVGLPFYSVYAGVKAGIARFGESLRRELEGEGVGVLTVYPTATDTPMMKTSGINPPGGRESAADVASAVIEAIRDERIQVVRGDAQVVLNANDPAAVDEQMRPMKAMFEAAAKDHSAL